ncbi:MAG: zinc-binding dehydrogenase, partial [Sciscionella sp.]|nr:zinc-binding dehydrogenase [Sciscionella sp.]
PVTYGDGWVERVRTAIPAVSTVDAVLDAAGAGVLVESVELAGGPRRVITIADYSGAQAAGVVFTGGPEDMRPIPEAFAEVFPLYAKGKLRLPIAGKYPLARAADALAASESGHVGGKLVLLP